MKSFIRSTAFAILGWFAFVAITGFTNYSTPARHPATILGSDSFPAGKGARLIFTSVGTVPAVVGSRADDLIMAVSTGLGAGALLATGTVYAGTTTEPAATLRRMDLYVSVASSSTAANEVFTVTDGTNTCTFTFACDATTGVKEAGGADGAGTGCSYAADTPITFSLTTQGCGTAMTVKSIHIYGLQGSL